MSSEESLEKVLFDSFNLKGSLLRGIYSYGFENPSAIQKKAVLKLWNEKI